MAKDWYPIACKLALTHRPPVWVALHFMAWQSSILIFFKINICRIVVPTDLQVHERWSTIFFLFVKPLIKWNCNLDFRRLLPSNCSLLTPTYNCLGSCLKWYCISVYFLKWYNLMESKTWNNFSSRAPPGFELICY